MELNAFSLAVICVLVSAVNCGNVLVISILSSKSHKNVFDPIARGLAQKGHTVTILSACKPNLNLENVKELQVLPGFDYFPTMNTMQIRREGIWGMMSVGRDHVKVACDDVYKHEEVQGFLRNQVQFDAVLFDMIANECFYGLAHRLKAPLVLVSTCAAPNFFTQIFGNRLPASFVPDPLLPFMDSMPFSQRVGNIVGRVVFDALWAWFMPESEEVYRAHLGNDTPGIQEILQETSLLLMNSHFTLNFPRPVLPGVVEIGGGHCRAGKPLPKDIEDFVSGAENGFIFFSLGSIVKPHEISQEIRDVFINVFNKLKYRVIWKWSDETMPGLSDNVKLLKWVPQQDVLAHPKVKLFMTHGGLLSLQEAVYHGVPVLGFPIFADQDLNSNRAKQAGMGEVIEILDITEAELEEKLNKILNDNTYKEKAQNLSVLFRDRRTHPVEDAVYWVEYIMRYKGAPQLRSAARNLTFLQYYSIDVLLFLLLATVAVLGLLMVIIMKSVQKICGFVRRRSGADKKKIN